jgi:lysophospholipase L1-like esterase
MNLTTYANIRNGLLRALLSLSFLISPLWAEDTPSLAIPASDDGLPGEGPIRRYDWFKNLWLKKRTGWANQIEQDQKSVVFLGDSITQGWSDSFHGHFEHLKKSNRGISGDTTRGVLIRMEEDVLSLNPAGIVLLIGTNDLEEGASPQVISDNVNLILKKLQNHRTDMPIILCQVFPSDSSMKRPASAIKQINQLYQKLAKNFAQVTVLDTWTLFANSEGNAKAEEFPDLLHPNGKGYAMWAASLRPLLATAGFLETTQDAFQLEKGFVSLFNGKNLDGWGFRDKRSMMLKSDFSGKKTSDDGRYQAINGRIVVTTPPEGRRIQQMWTTMNFPENFILKLEFRATPNADSGVFIRRPQLQCRDYPLAGPYKDLKNYKPQDWNELIIKVTDNIAHCTCNGEVLEEAFQLPATGPIGLEGDRGQMEYRRIRLKRLK